jgi:hypothetical protein
MSRNLSILLIVMCAAIAGLIIYSKSKPAAGPRSDSPSDNATVSPAPTAPPTPGPVSPTIVEQTPVTPPVSSSPVTPSTVAPPPLVSVVTTGLVPRPPGPGLVMTNLTEDPDMKPLPVLEKNYLTTTNRDDRLDIMMDITDWPGPEAVRTLTRLFQSETDPDLKVDLLDSLLGIEGQVEEKLAMLTLGTQKGLPTEVRQSAIDGLIDLDDQRIIPVLNGLLNDPDEEIREGAKDALEMMQSQPAVLK